MEKNLSDKFKYFKLIAIKIENAVLIAIKIENAVMKLLM